MNRGMPCPRPIGRPRSAPRVAAIAVALALAGLAATGASLATAAGPRTLLAPFGDGPQPAAPWRVALLPDQTRSATRFALADETIDGRTERVLRIEADASYGNLLHPLDPADGAAVAADPRAVLSWRWQVTQANPAIDLREKRGDDTDVKVCVLYDLPLDAVPLGERTLMRLARLRSGEPLPAATVCYVTDARLPAGTALDNRYSRRVRYLVLRSPSDTAGAWKAESRRLADDFRRLFGDESVTVPPVRAIAVGADADDTRRRSRAAVARLVLTLPADPPAADPSTPR